jgi:ferritin-like metal-binding protein YciE
MKLLSAHIEDLRKLYISNLKKALDKEQKITNALPDLIENSSDSELATETCKVIDGLTTEASDTIKDVTNPSVRDIALIGAAQQVEHHEIAVYGTLARWAEILGLASDLSVLKSIEAEESMADELLTEIASTVNLKAAA